MSHREWNLIGKKAGWDGDPGLPGAEETDEIIYELEAMRNKLILRLRGDSNVDVRVENMWGEVVVGISNSLEAAMSYRKQLATGKFPGSESPLN